MSTDSPALSTRLAAAHVGVCYSNFRTLLAAGRGPRVLYREGAGRGRGCFFAVTELDRWKAERRPVRVYCVYEDQPTA